MFVLLPYYHHVFSHIFPKEVSNIHKFRRKFCVTFFQVFNKTKFLQKNFGFKQELISLLPREVSCIKAINNRSLIAMIFFLLLLGCKREKNNDFLLFFISYR